MLHHLIFLYASISRILSGLILQSLTPIDKPSFDSETFRYQIYFLKFNYQNKLIFKGGILTNGKIPKS